MSKISVAVGHLNTPYGNVVQEEDFAAVLRAGTLKIESDTLTPSAVAIISGTFTENTPNLMIMCMHEAGATLESVNRLYVETVKEGAYPSPKWEATVAHFL